MNRDWAARIEAAVTAHPEVRAVRLVGSRAEGRASALSDWDFEVEVDSFKRVANDLPRLLQPLTPLAFQWDRLSRNKVAMLLLKGPTKIDLIFQEPHEPEPPWQLARETLPALDAHFWDWVLWLGAKQAVGNRSLVESELEKMFSYLLRPVGVADVPRSVSQAADAYRAARNVAEPRLGVSVSRDIEREVVAVLPE